MSRRFRFAFLVILLAIGGSILCSRFMTPAHAYVEAAMSLGAVVAQSTNIVLMRVEAVDKQNNIIVYRKVSDIKGKHPQDVIKHNIGRGGLRANEWKPQMDWAEPGKLAVFFHNGGASETCIGTWWYQAYGGGEWWNHSHGEPYLLRSFAGSPEKLANIVAAMLTGQEVVAPCMVDGDREDLHNRRAKIQRLKVSLKLQDYNPKRDFVGWGGDDFRRLFGMQAFTHYSALPKIDEPQALSIVDYNGDGKPDICLVGAGKVVLLQNGGEALNEVMLPGVTGARAAVWADYNLDGKPDLFLATANGPKLLTNLGGDKFRDDSHLLPKEAFYNLTAAAWIDYDGDGRPDLLLANGYHGLRLYRNTGLDKPEMVQQEPVKKPVPAKKVEKVPEHLIPAKGPAFVDVSEDVGLGPNGIAGTLKGDSLTVCDVNGDGRPDILYGAGSGILLLASKNKDGLPIFIESKDSGLSFTTGKVGPVFGDFNGDGYPDLFVPQRNGCKLYTNDGKGHFTDVTAKAGDLAGNLGWVTSGAWGDFDNDGKLDLLLGCLKGPNRMFRNKGDGTFEEITEKVGLGQKIFNSQAVALVDLNNDGMLDIVCNNEGQESCVLLGNLGYAEKQAPLMVTVAGKEGVVGSKVWISDKSGKVCASQQLLGGEGRGGQPALQARFVLQPGPYFVNVQYSTGTTRRRQLEIATDPMRAQIDEQTPIIGQ